MNQQRYQLLTKKNKLQPIKKRLLLFYGRGLRDFLSDFNTCTLLFLINSSLLLEFFKIFEIFMVWINHKLQFLPLAKLMTKIAQNRFWWFWSFTRRKKCNFLVYLNHKNFKNLLKTSKSRLLAKTFNNNKKFLWIEFTFQ